MEIDFLGKVLAAEEPILPSSGFLTAVMDDVRREAATPPPISFPWKAALPGIAAALTVLVSILLAVVSVLRTSHALADSDPMATLLMGTIRSSIRLGFGWVAVALFLSAVAIVASTHFAATRAERNSLVRH